MDARILAIDTTSESCSVAIWSNGIVFTRFFLVSRNHEKKILPMIRQCLIDANLDLQHIDALAFGCGPGNFTGVRIAAGVAQGLSFGVNLPIIKISSLLTMSQGAYRKLNKKKVLVAIDAKIKEVYFAFYELQSDGYWYGENTESIIKIEQFLTKINKLNDNWAIAGNAWLSYPILMDKKLNLLKSDIFMPYAKDMLVLALQKLESGEIIYSEKAWPIYIRNKFT
ncbi:tRNA threonylcarbamoyladenosine biosynthesis protein TsaB [Candidatus Arsenophonus lipoptenae]|uniref:tRNA threonylcarbamoyladenosine biosynthesis protein TsaB n=1 Tax=Candidatus Arsenophonus lipoptenae TaxID=634113 RepID=A0A0X9VJM5_9GAMM|nr:tRNA (adenosine(37)-N6)-threonylcarbamoyltransferase complex dimerization subunit type 1 TsaB [Candidatus Arsenophonus lipoptenae]AMA65215.1 tRNA threonylcarbamoyladenosine biosynthesis protein TsaB [Candidatus Arsenophonus lipoptenae]